MASTMAEPAGGIAEDPQRVAAYKAIAGDQWGHNQAGKDQIDGDHLHRGRASK